MIQSASAKGTQEEEEEDEEEFVLKKESSSNKGNTHALDNFAAVWCHLKCLALHDIYERFFFFGLRFGFRRKWHIGLVFYCGKRVEPASLLFYFILYLLLLFLLHLRQLWDFTGDLTVKVDGKSSDQKAVTPRSKHSATEQRRRSKINDRRVLPA